MDDGPLPDHTDSSTERLRVGYKRYLEGNGAVPRRSEYDRRTKYGREDTDAVQQHQDQAALSQEIRDQEDTVLPPAADAESQAGDSTRCVPSASEEDIVFLVLAYALRHGLSKSGLGDLLDLLAAVGAENIPRSKYNLLKHVTSDISDSKEIHAYCGKCLAYLGVRDAACAECGDATCRAERLKEGTFFTYIPLKEQMKTLLESGRIESQLVEGRSQDGVIRDSVDGAVSRETGPIGSSVSAAHLSLTWNVDGVPIHQSSKTSIYPILATINELKPKARRDEVLMCGLWFGKGSPCWSIYSKPFLQELKELSTGGVQWTKNGLAMTTMVSAHGIVCDSVARCMVQGTQQFNGAFGCGWCLQETVPYDRVTDAGQQGGPEGAVSGRGSVRVYPYRTNVEPRTTNNVIECARVAEEEKLPHYKGVKHASQLLLLPAQAGVDIVNSFAVDYMHAVLLGVVRQFLRLWFGSEHSHADFSIRRHTDRVSVRLTAIRPPHDIARTPRSVSDADCWKASECRSWLLFYCVPVLCGILPQAFLHHWCLLVAATFTLLGDAIDEVGITRAERQLKAFVKGTQALYGLRHMSSNVHLLLHLPDTVRRLGPLWACSAFPYERYMMVIKRKLFHGTTYVPQQIANNFILLHTVRRWMHDQQGSPERELAKKWVGYPDIESGVRSIEGVIGLQRRVAPLEARVADLLTGNGVDASEGTLVEMFKRSIIGGKVVCTEQYGKHHKRNSYTVSTRYGICSVQNIFFLPVAGSLQAFLVVKLHEETPHSFHHSIRHFLSVRCTGSTILCRPGDIGGTVVVVSEDPNGMICALQPNGYEKD